MGEKYVYLAFSNTQKGRTLQSEFEESIKKAITENRLIGLFSSELDYKHALYPKNNFTNIIQWNLAPKLYNKKTKRLEMLKREVDYSQYLIKQLPKHHFEIMTKTPKLSQKIENMSLTACSFNIKRNEKQINSLYFSKPAHVFIKPKLFFLNNSALNEQLKSNEYNHMVNLPLCQDSCRLN
jgi:hypothetical protein